MWNNLTHQMIEWLTAVDGKGPTTQTWAVAPTYQNHTQEEKSSYNTGFSKISYDGHISVTIFRENYNIETPNRGRYGDPLPPYMYSSVYDK